MKCPKCNFEQPDDQYCANCGVDIISYHAPKKKFNFRKSLFSETSLMVVVLVTFLGFAGNHFFISKETPLNSSKKAKNTPLRLGVSKTKLSPQQTESSTAAPSSEVNSKQATQVSDSSKVPTSTEDTSNQASHLQSQTTPEPKAKSPSRGTASVDSRDIQSKTVASNAKAVTAFEVVYAEMDQGSLQMLVDEARLGGKFSDFPDHAVGILQVANKKDSPIGLARPLENDTKDLDSAKMAQWVDAVVSPKENSQIGLFFSIEVNKSQDLTRGVTSGSLDISRNWPEGNEGNQVTPFPPISFELDKNSVLFIAGLIPRKSSAELEEAFLTSNIFKVLKRDSDFMTRKTELVIFIRPLEK